jgi:hypothetical protein
MAAFVTAAILMAGISGCFDRASGRPMRGNPPLDQAALSVLVADALNSSGVPDPPLRKTSTRAERRDYLASTEGALRDLAKLPHARLATSNAGNRLLPEDNTSNVLSISKLLGVELADSIDRSQPERAERAIRLAFAYADSISTRSVPDWVASGAVADTLALAVASVTDQMDEELAERLVLVTESLEKTPPNPDRVLMSDANRIGRWLESIEQFREDVPSETVPHMIGMDPSSRAFSSPEFRKAIESFAPNGQIPHEVLWAECRIAGEQVRTYLMEPRGPRPTVDGGRHPIGALVMTMLNPTVNAAPDLAALRNENLRLLALAIRLSSSPLPEEISSLGDIAHSPVNNLPFEYKRADGGFELVRPRVKAGP